MQMAMLIKPLHPCSHIFVMVIFNDLVYPNAEDLRLVMNLELDANDEVVPYKKPANEVVEDYKKEIAERFIELINKR